MLDRKVVEEFLLEELDDVDVPEKIKKEELVEAFCQFTEDDFYEWLKDNFNTFFNHGNPDWDWVENCIQQRINGTIRKDRDNSI